MPHYEIRLIGYVGTDDLYLSRSFTARSLTLLKIMSDTSFRFLMFSRPGSCRVLLFSISSLCLYYIMSCQLCQPPIGIFFSYTCVFYYNLCVMYNLYNYAPSVGFTENPHLSILTSPFVQSAKHLVLYHTTPHPFKSSNPLITRSLTLLNFSSKKYTFPRIFLINPFIFHKKYVTMFACLFSGYISRSKKGLQNYAFFRRT